MKTLLVLSIALIYTSNCFGFMPPNSTAERHEAQINSERANVLNLPISKYELQSASDSLQGLLMVNSLTDTAVLIPLEEKIDSRKINLNKNSINLSYGIASVHFSYERLWQGKVFGSKNSTIVDFGLGGLAHWEGYSPYIISRFGILTGSGSRHFEAKAGACFFWAGDVQGILLPSASIGYRKQKPGSRFIFRTGIGFPDFLYVSWGYSF